MQATHTINSTSLPEGKLDVLVIGGGIIGLATACDIKRVNPSLRVLLIDKAPAAGQGDTAKSAAGLRNIFSSEISRALSESTIDFYEEVQEKHGVDLGLRFVGYLWLMSKKQFEHFESLEISKEVGTKFKIMSTEEVKEKIPGFTPSAEASDDEAQLMSLEDVDACVLGIRCGVIATERIVRFYKEEFLRLGGEVLYSLPVEKILVEPKSRLGIDGESFEWQQKIITGVKTSRGEIRARKIVIAPGAWGRELLDPIGVDCHMNPIRKMIFVIRGQKVESLLHTPGFNEYGLLPFTVLPKGGIYVRPVPGEEAFYTAMTEGLGSPYATSENPPVDERFYTYNLNPILSRYFPMLRAIRPSSMWAGRQDKSATDKNPYIFERANAVIALGTSGNGIMKADAIGRIAGALVRGEEVAELYGGRKFDVSKVGVSKRVIEPELFELA